MDGENSMNKLIKTALACIAGSGLLVTSWAVPAYADTPFSDISPPTISGTTVVGKELTAVADTDTAPIAETITYQWQRSGNPISGATRTKLTLTASDLDQRLSVEVCYASVDVAIQCVTSAETEAIAPGTLTAGSVAVTGSAKVGATLRAVKGTWTSGASISYRWLRDGKSISGATKSSYKATATDLGKRIQVQVTGKKAGYSSRSKTSARTAKVAAGTLSAGSVSVTGSAKVGATLRAVKGTWTSGTSISYRWLRNGKAISGATKSSYKVSSADRGKRIQVQVTGKKAGYSTRSKSSANTAGVSFLTTVQSRAVSTARGYLGFMPFSRAGLIDQLEFEGFSSATSRIAVDYVNPSWAFQAAESAEGYIDTFGWSHWTRSSLYGQLRYEGFTSAQANYALDAVGMYY